MHLLPQRAESLLVKEVEEALEKAPAIRWMDRIFEGVAAAAQVPKEYLFGSSVPSTVLQQKLHQALLDREASVLGEVLPEQDCGGEVVGLVKQGQAAFVPRPEKDRSSFLEFVESFRSVHIPSVPLLSPIAYSKGCGGSGNKTEEDELVDLVEDRLLNGPPRPPLSELFKVLDAAPLKAPTLIMNQQDLDDIVAWFKKEEEKK